MDAPSGIKTVIVDIDGCVFRHRGMNGFFTATEADVLPGVRERFAEWLRGGYFIILATGRPDSLRELTVRQLEAVRIPYHHLIMGLPRGARVVINDTKPDSDEPTAHAVVVPRNEGLVNVDV